MRNLIDDVPSKKNHDFIDNIRCLAMISIVVDHSMDLGDYTFKLYSPSFWTYVVNIQLAKFGTISFFLLAGFLLGDKFTQYTPGQYLKRRINNTFKPWAIWSLLFLAGLLIRDGLNYMHFGSGGFDFWAFFKDELAVVYLYSNYWFIINFLICIAILLTFKKNLYSWKLGAALLLCTLFYCVNVYYEWITPLHTTALFGFVFFLWLGAQFNKHWSFVDGVIKKTPFLVFILACAACFTLTLYEATFLFDFKSLEPFNTLRISNIFYSLAVFALLLKIRNFDFVRFFKPRETTFGIYLIHAIFVYLILPEILIHFEIGKAKDMEAPQLFLYQFLRFSIVYILTFVVVTGINKTSFRGLIGNSTAASK